MKNLSVYGIYKTRSQLEHAMEQLRIHNFGQEEIGVLIPESSGNKDLAFEQNSKAPEGSAVGGSTGAVVGGTLGWLMGIGAIVIPGLGAFVAAGPILAALAGLGTGAALGGFAGGLAGIGMPEYEAKRYEGRVRSGGILISVHCQNSDRASMAGRILRETGAQEISSAGEASVGTDLPEQPSDRTTFV